MDLEYKTGYRNSGRKPGIIDYKFVTYNNKEYVVGILQHTGEDVKFVIDKDDFPKIEKRPWHLTSGKYIGSTFYLDGGHKLELYLHNLIMDKITFDGKGTKETVDHINRNGLDNRKENLRILSQSQQNINQGKKIRRVELPEGCPIKPEEIPKHIWYVRANGLHGDRFAIEFKTESVCWKTTSSKKVDLTLKLQDAKVKLQEFYLQYPHLNPQFEESKCKELTESFNEIIRAAHSPSNDSAAS
jgi:hypothetical protein